MRKLEACRYRDATHNTWAYRIETQLRFNDDGEPGGTAGRPILAVIDRLSLDHVLVVVTRWFGGIKLGASGLARAYGGTAAACLQHAIIHEIRSYLRCLISVPFSDVSRVYTFLELAAVGRQSDRFTAEGIEFTIDIAEAEFKAFESGLRETTKGRSTIQTLGLFQY